eukprot:TRINITY_DN19552_c0_g2_i1.p1 TRINITY_DN19552_c0_g2~~TRINITY_DN19552_c0_g2_i1.p1  ORF type:complete len:688 (+),score=239.89 TRINITY_DN19552_c0_g2_i1:74-2065(+)
MGGKGAYYKAKYGGGGKGGGGGGGGGGGSSWGGGGGGGGGWGGKGRGGGGSGGGGAEDTTPWQGSSARGTSAELEAQLSSLEGRQYPCYRDLECKQYNFPQGFSLAVDRTQNDPFAPPSKMRVLLPAAVAGYPADALSTPVRRTALADFLQRRFWEAIHQRGLDEFKGGGGGYHAQKGGEINIERPSQHVLERTAVVVAPGGDIEVRYTMSLPAHGRTIEGYRAVQIIIQRLPAVVTESLPASVHDPRAVSAHLDSVEDQEWLRGQLAARGLCAFVRDGATLPRRGGDDDRPMEGSRASGVRPVTFATPRSLEVSFNLPHHGKIQGMGIPVGVTVIVGGGFHGKSTLLRALEVGVYNHIPGDGREFVVCDYSAVKIRAEDKRSVASVDISTFLNNLPLGKDTTDFSTQEASGSTSQATNILEALEVGSRLLLIDEDTCATNFMIRDRRMQRLVAKTKEPITPFVHKVRQLFQEHGVSTICVIGGAGDYLEAADHVVMLDSYVPRDVTAEAREVCAALPQAELGAEAQRAEAGVCFGKVVPRCPQSESIMRSVGEKAKIFPRGLGELVFGDETIDLACVEQIVERCQVQAIGDALLRIARFCDGRKTLADVLDELAAEEKRQEKTGLDVYRPWGPPHGSYSRPRRFELAAALNRLRTLAATQRR